MSVTAEDTSCPNGFVQLMELIVAPEEPVFDQGSDALAMRARGSFEFCQHFIDIILRRTDSTTTQDKFSRRSTVQCHTGTGDGHSPSPEFEFRGSANGTKQIQGNNRKTEAG